VKTTVCLHLMKINRILTVKLGDAVGKTCFLMAILVLCGAKQAAKGIFGALCFLHPAQARRRKPTASGQGYESASGTLKGQSFSMLLFLTGS
jgi:hypothetical protein